MKVEHDLLERRLGAALTVLALLLFPWLLWRGWGAWNDVLVDYGRELYVPWRITEGDVLYRDLAYFNGPLSAYLNALVFTVLGVSLRSLTIANVLVTALTGWLLHRRLRAVGGPLSAGAGLAVFFVVFACGRFPGVGNYNFLAPYSHELTHGLLLALLAFECALRGARAGGERWALGSGLLLGLVFLTKAEVLLGVGAAVLWLHLLRWRSMDGGWKPLGLSAAAALVPPVLACALLSLAMPLGDALVGTAGTWAGLFGSETAELVFYERTMGTDLPVENLKLVLTSLGSLLLFLVPALLLDRLTSAWKGPRRLAAAAACALAAAAAVLAAQPDLYSWFTWTRCLPLVALGAWVLASWRALTAPDAEREAWAERAAFGLFALVMMAKILLVVTVGHYGFALALLGSLLFLVISLEWLPRMSGGPPLPGVVLRAVSLGLVGALAFAFERTSEETIDSLTVTVGEGADAFRAEPLRGEGVQQLCEQIGARTRPGQSVLVLPEGILVNYLTRRRTPTRHINFMPPELALFGEEEIVKELRAAPPDALALVHKDTSEYGYPLFGIDYGQRIVRWAQRRYQYDWNWGQQPLQPGTAFGVGLLGPR